MATVALLGPLPPVGLRPVSPAAAPTGGPEPAPAPVGPALSPEEFLLAPVAAAKTPLKTRPPEPPISPRELHGRVSPAIVALVVTGGTATPTVATGTLVTASGLIVTSRSAVAAAVDGTATLSVVRGNGGSHLPARALTEAVPARVVAAVAELDLAVVEAMPTESVFYPHLPVARRAVPETTPLLAVGHASKRGLWAGRLANLGSARARTGAERWLRALAGDAATLEPGTPLVDSVGRIVAVTVEPGGSGGRAAVDGDGLLRFLLAADAPNLRFAGVPPFRRPVPNLATVGAAPVGGRGPAPAGAGPAATTAETGESDADAMPTVARKGLLDRRFSARGPETPPGGGPSGGAPGPVASVSKATRRGPTKVSFATGDGPLHLTLAELERHAAPATLRLDGDSPARGAASAPVTILELGDFHSPETRQVERTVRGLVEGDAAPARLLWKDTDRGDGPDYHLPARATRAAGEQDDFWSMHDRLMHGPTDPTALNLGKVRKLAEDLELDGKAFLASLLSPGSAGAAELDAQRAGRLPVLCTPAFVVNGQIIEGGSIAGPALLAAVDDEVAAFLARTAPSAPRRPADAPMALEGSAHEDPDAPKGAARSAAVPAMPAGLRSPRAIAAGGPINGTTFDPAKMARVVADATAKRAAKR